MFNIWQILENWNQFGTNQLKFWWIGTKYWFLYLLIKKRLEKWIKVDLITKIRFKLEKNADFIG